MKKVRLGDICTVVSGTTPKSHVDEYWNGDKVWITPAEINEDTLVVTDSVRHISESAVKDSSLKSFPKGTVILSSRAPIGKTAIAGCEMYCNQGFKNLICSEKINNLYLLYFLRSRKDYLNSLGRGATFKEISKGIVENIKVPLPSIDTQIQIGNRIRTIEKLIGLRKKQLFLLDDLIKSRFVEMFGLPNKNKYGFEISHIGDVVCDVHYGTSKKATEHGKFTYIRMNNITYNGELNLTDTKKISVSENEIIGCAVKKGDILFNRTNSRELVGKTCVFNQDEPMIIAGYIIRLRMNGRVLPEYLSTFLNLSCSKKMLMKMAKGAVGQANINSQEVQSIMILVPPIEIQNCFQQIVHHIDKSKLSTENSRKMIQNVIKYREK